MKWSVSNQNVASISSEPHLQGITYWYDGFFAVAAAPWGFWNVFGGGQYNMVVKLPNPNLDCQSDGLKTIKIWKS